MQGKDRDPENRKRDISIKRLMKKDFQKLLAEQSQKEKP